MGQELFVATGIVVFNPALALEMVALVLGWVPLPIARLAVGTLSWSALLLVAWFGTRSHSFDPSRTYRRG